jgi:hypothetical protein
MSSFLMARKKTERREDCKTVTSIRLRCAGALHANVFGYSPRALRMASVIAIGEPRSR